MIGTLLQWLRELLFHLPQRTWQRKLQTHMVQIADESEMWRHERNLSIPTPPSGQLEPADMDARKKWRQETDALYRDRFHEPLTEIQPQLDRYEISDRELYRGDVRGDAAFRHIEARLRTLADRATLR